MRSSQNSFVMLFLFYFVQDNITLEKLNLQGNWIEGDGGSAMARMLEDNDYITELVSKIIEPGHVTSNNVAF